MPRTKKKVKSIVKTKVISARVTETAHELLHQQAEDTTFLFSLSAGLTFFNFFTASTHVFVLFGQVQGLSAFVRIIKL